MSWVLVFLGFSLLIILHEAGHFLAAKATGMRVERFFLFFGPTIWSFKRGETEYGIKSIPLGGYVKITGMNPEEDIPPEIEGRAYYRQPVWRRIVVTGAGPAVNITMAFLIFFGAFALNGMTRIDQSVGGIKSGTPAAKALHRGDRIIAIDGRRFPRLSTEERLERFAGIVKRHRCPGPRTQGCLASTPVTLTIARSGRIMTLSIRPHYEESAKRMLIGFEYGEERVSLAIGSAASEAGRVMWSVSSRTLHVVTHLFESQERKQVAGVVGISDIGHQVIEQGLERALLLLALVSLSLGLINLLPILPLDGGHIFWSLVEKLRGRPVSLRVMEGASMIGLAIVAMLILIGLNNDIGRLSGEGFRVR
jgi:regulator of sigma E protease